MKNTLRLIVLGAAGLFVVSAMNVATVRPASACLVEADGDAWDCGALYCAQDGNYPNNLTKKCLPRGFLGTHKQKSSTAGDCPTCTISILGPQPAPVFAMIANNGWVATMRYDDEKRTSASGQGTWPADGPFPDLAGQEFTVTLKKQGTKIIKMTVNTGGGELMSATFSVGKRPPPLAVGLVLN